MKALDGLDPALEHRVRLAICVLLARHGEISFAAFKQQLDLTDGNLGAQLRRLEDAGYLALRRDFVERKPVTWYRLTAAGRKALDRHLRALREVIGAAGG
ncbi:winged helix-turn-helix domain-containing protein [Vulcaniibacterium gelatinicum]|uniref:winged helix-turn-helix domain-containing protein n=1 Tax=Vulcaniibacterium gelatinicum TaxID=2598725 RepID=UPI0011C72C50|nr:transcriptional regulator [Vulcaniibacterium gelatinicum]